jgi:hypothetical protein
LSNEEKTNDYEKFEKGMIFSMKILKKRGVVEKRGEEETKSMRGFSTSFPYGKLVENPLLNYCTVIPGVNAINNSAVI